MSVKPNEFFVMDGLEGNGVISIALVLSSDLCRTFVLENEKSFFVIFSLQSFFVRNNSGDESIPPCVFYISNLKKIHVGTFCDSGFVICITVDSDIYGGDCKHIVGALLKEKLLVFNEFKSLYDNIFCFNFEPKYMGVYLRSLIYSLPVIYNKYKFENVKCSLFERIEFNVRNHAHVPDLYLEQVASLCFCSKRTLQNALAKKGVSFSELTNNIRVELFCGLLENSRLSVEDISFRCGFNSASYAIKLFRKKMGLTPSQYRRSVLYRNVCL